jgi:uncharacterized integral membrane protein
VYNFLGNVIKLEYHMVTWHVFPVIVFSVNADDMMILMIYLLTAVGLTPGGSSTVHIYTQTIHRTTHLTTLVGRLSGTRTQSGQTKINDGRTV